MSKLVSGLLFGLALVALGQAFHLPRKQEILIVDVDAGADDATALLTLLGMEAKNKSPYKIEAITTVNGNTPITNVIPNVLKTLKAIDRLDIKVYEGAHASILGESIADNFFGEDGFGDFDYPNPPKPQDYLQPGSAADAMIDLVHKNPGQVTILCLGPLTNLALAINLNNTFFGNVKEVIIMGGSVRGVGNISPGVEFNARVDPEANKIVLTKEPRPKIVIVPWEAASELGVDMEWRTKVLGSLNTPSVELLNKAEAVAIKKSGDVWTSADSIAAVVLVQPDAAEDIDHDLVLAETQGEYGRGAFFVKYTANVDQPPNAYIVQKVNIETYKSVLLENLA